jgi:hypothetical protein
MECTADKNSASCTCTYSSCSKRGKCCQCVQYHHALGELPGCFFPQAAELTYDRSREAYIKAFTKKNP